MNIRFAPKDRLPMQEGLVKYHHLINLIGIRLMILYYARELGTDFSFQDIKSTKGPSADLFNFYCMEYALDGWSETGLEDVYPEQFYDDNSFAQYIDPELYDMDSNYIEKNDYGSIFNLGTMTSSAWLAFSEQSEGKEYTPSDDAMADISKILFDRYISSKKIPYPDTDGGKLAEMGINGVIDFLFSKISGNNEYSTDFLETTALRFCSLLERIFFMEDGEDGSAVANCYAMTHPYGQAVLDFLKTFNDEGDENYSFYKKASELATACMKQIESSTCETGEDPDWYDYDIYTDGKSLAVEIIYPVHSDTDISVVVLAIYLLKKLILEVFQRAGEKIKTGE